MIENWFDWIVWTWRIYSVLSIESGTIPRSEIPYHEQMEQDGVPPGVYAAPTAGLSVRSRDYGIRGEGYGSIDESSIFVFQRGGSFRVLLEVFLIGSD